MSPEETLKESGLILSKVLTPGGNYVSINVRVNIAYVAIQFPIENETYLYQGRLGNHVSTTEGYEAMKLCALNVLAQVKGKIEYENILGLNVYFQSGRSWNESPEAVDGASDLFVNILGDRGRHSRAIFGVETLPRNFSAGLTSSFTLKQKKLHE